MQISRSRSRLAIEITIALVDQVPAAVRDLGRVVRASREQGSRRARRGGDALRRAERPAGAPSELRAKWHVDPRPRPRRAVAPAVRRDGDVPLPVRAADAGAVVDPRDHGIGLRDDRIAGLQGHDQVLGQAVRHQLRDGHHDRDHARIPVRHQLGLLLALRRRHLRRAAGDRGPDGVLPRVDDGRALLLRLEPAGQGPAPRR